jgi:hypothetical protein
MCKLHVTSVLTFLKNLSSSYRCQQTRLRRSHATEKASQASVRLFVVHQPTVNSFVEIV